MILTKDKFDQITRGISYWNNRWNYLGPITEIVKSLKFQTSVEAGTCAPGMLIKPVKIISTSLDIRNENIFDLNQKNWPFKCDLFIATQVFEHLKDKEQAFAELKKCTKYALLSFPYMWETPKDLDHHLIDEDKIMSWAKIAPIRSYKAASRIINLYEFSG